MKKKVLVLFLLSVLCGLFCFGNDKKDNRQENKRFFKFPGYEYLMVNINDKSFDLLSDEISCDLYSQILYSSVYSPEDINTNLNTLGRLGWELISSDNSKKFIFKRLAGFSKKDAEETLINQIIRERAEKIRAKTVKASEKSEQNINAGNKTTLTVWSFTEEVISIAQKFAELHPELNIKINPFILEYLDGSYQAALDKALKEGGTNAPDIYAAEFDFSLKYVNGDMQDYAMPYKNLGIDVEKACKDALIAPYTIDIGKNSKGEINGLSYKTTGGCFIYRRSIAKKVFGTDKPEAIQEIIGGGTANWDKFLNAADECSKKGYAVISGIGDIWRSVIGSAEKSWVVDGKLYIDPVKEKLLDIAKTLYEKNLTNNTSDWSDEWFNDFKGTGSRQAFGFFGPAWFVKCTLEPNCGSNTYSKGTYGDWAICLPPSGFFWGGTNILVNKKLPDTKKEAAKALIEWITLNTSKDGLLDRWASGSFTNIPDSVASGFVMAKAYGKNSFLKEQNSNEYFMAADLLARGDNLSQYDADINYLWIEQVRLYAEGKKTRANAIKDFKKAVADNLGIN